MATLSELANFRLRVVETVIDAIYATTCRADLRENPALKGLQQFWLQVSLGNPGLIGNDCDAQSEIVQ